MVLALNKELRNSRDQTNRLEAELMIKESLLSLISRFMVDSQGLGAKTPPHTLKGSWDITSKP